MIAGSKQVEVLRITEAGGAAQTIPRNDPSESMANPHRDADAAVPTAMSFLLNTAFPPIGTGTGGECAFVCDYCHAMRILGYTQIKF
jgi:hypothetical protein